MNNTKKTYNEREKNSPMWIGFFILFFPVNLLFGYVLIANIITRNALDFDFAMVMSPFLLYISIIDFMAVRSYRRNQSPPWWEVFLIPLLGFTVVFLYFIAWAIPQSAGAMGGHIIIPIAGILVLIDFIAVLFYVHTHIWQPGRREKVISTILLTVVILVLFAAVFTS